MANALKKKSSESKKRLKLPSRSVLDAFLIPCRYEDFLNDAPAAETLA